MFTDLFAILFNNGCYTCGAALSQQETCICLSCLSQLNPTDFHKSPNNNELFFRFAGKVDIKAAASLYYFDKQGYLQKLLHQLKYQNHPEVGVFLGKLMATIWQKSDFLHSIEVLIPIPLHAKKEQLRGYNQAYEICKGISEITKLPIDNQIITRQKNTQTQTRKSLQERWHNVEDAFITKSSAYKNILLIDDVITTGATIEACIRALEKQQQKDMTISVGSVALARSRA